MRKTLWVVFAILLVACAFMQVTVNGAHAATGSCTVAYSTTGSPDIQKIVVTCTGGTAGEAGQIANTTIVPRKGWIFLAETNPGTTAPTDNYDLVLNNVNGIDVMGGALMNRDEANSEAATPAVSGWLDGGALTLVVTNNSVASSTFTLTLWIWVQN